MITTKALAYLDSKVPKSIPSGAGVAYADFDNDGKIDLYLANNSQPSLLYLNKGNGNFQNVTTTFGLSSAGNQGTDGRMAS